jgi:hypothetical protein
MEIFASGVADTAGEVTLTFSAPGMGMALSGTLTVPGVDASAGWLCKKNGHTIGGWLGQSAFGPVTANDQETIALVGTGLSAGQQVQACWHVVQGRSGDFSSVVPLAVMPAAQAGISGTVDANITGPVTVETASGTPVDANITNASIPVSGSVDATIQNATLDITGSTVDLASGSTVGVSGGQLTNSSGIAVQPSWDVLPPSLMSNGSSGSVTFTANTTMTGEPSYVDVTVNAGVTLNTNGFPLRGTGTLLVYGTIENSGEDASTTASAIALGGGGGFYWGGAEGVTLVSSGAGASATGNAAPGRPDVLGGGGGSVQINRTLVTPSYGPPQGWGTPGGYQQFSMLGGGCSGNVSVDATSGDFANSGGGGGPVVCIFDSITIESTGLILAQGGNGYASGSKNQQAAGGGGGGIILLLANSLTTVSGGISSAAGGAGWQAGALHGSNNGYAGRNVYWVML